MSLQDLLKRLFRRITQIPGVRSLWCRFPIGPLRIARSIRIFSRPYYAFGVYAAGDLAARLGIPAISVIEFGVAGGKGLLELERIAAEVSHALGVKIAVYGFDSGEGMPAPVDYRDLPHVWQQGFYKMDQAALKASRLPRWRLRRRGRCPHRRRVYLSVPAAFVHGFGTRRSPLVRHSLGFLLDPQHTHCGGAEILLNMQGNDAFYL